MPATYQVTTNRGNEYITDDIRSAARIAVRWNRIGKIGCGLTTEARRVGSEPVKITTVAETAEALAGE